VCREREYRSICIYIYRERGGVCRERIQIYIYIHREREREREREVVSRQREVVYTTIAIL
jgi:hypothetical protein